ncbi:MAG: CDP-alcohol phosphatidyltransferase family protein [Deltaproteobacteria bacterium]|nr:CDP-alcohol phosphatidyltransferase family protein [Deltaproteobacteria bacterium]
MTTPEVARLRASFLRVMLALCASCAATDIIFFASLPRSTFGTLVAVQAGVFAPIVPLGIHYLGLVRDPQGKLHRRWVLPNVLTAARIFAIPSIVIGLQHLEGWRVRLGVGILFVIASTSDMLDGFISRRFKRQSDLGRALDPFADTLFYSSVTAALFATGRLPYWFLVVALARFVPSFIVGFMLFLRRGPIEISPTLLGKASSFSMGIATLTFVLDALGVAVPPPVERWISYGVAALCAASAIEYALVGYRRLGSRPSVQ